MRTYFFFHKNIVLSTCKTIIILLFSLWIVVFFTECDGFDSSKCEQFGGFEPAMVINCEFNNSIGGTAISVQSVDVNNGAVILDAPDGFLDFFENKPNWYVGWGNNRPYYDAGCENMRPFVRILLQKKQVVLGDLLRGNGFPEAGQEVVFWNSESMGFKQIKTYPIVDHKMWPDFAGSSIHFADVIFDDSLKKYVMFVNEFDTSQVQLYAACSNDLKEWLPLKNGEPLIRKDDFNKCQWLWKDSLGNIQNYPITTEIIYKDNKYYVFFHGYITSHNRAIGIAVSESSVFGPYRFQDDPVVLPGESDSWNAEASFFCRILRFKNKYIMAFDGDDEEGEECVGIAFSNDLQNWTQHPRNPVISDHVGWRSYEGASEPAAIYERNDSIFLFVAGAMGHNDGLWQRFVTRDRYMNKPGNVDDIQIGVWVSVDTAKTFVLHCNNPVLVNDYSSKVENGHMGASVEFIKTDTCDFIIYQAKTNFPDERYNILIKKSKHKRLVFENNW